MALMDQAVLASNSNFQNRVSASLLAACVAIQNEGWAIAFHRERSTFAASVLSAGPAGPMVQAVASTVATDTSVISDATQAGTVTLGSSNVGAQQALVTDAHINTAVSGQFNTFFRTPA